jgi:LysM repeat protein
MMNRSTAILLSLSFLLAPAVAQETKTPKLDPIPKIEGKPKPAPPESSAPADPAQPAPKPARTAPAKPEESEPEKYVIQKGDNPWKVAKDHGIELSKLLSVNKIKDPKNLMIGDVLVLPKGVKSKNRPAPAKPVAGTPVAGTPAPVVAKPVPAKPEPAPAESGENWKLYTIAKGDNPWTIAKKLDVEHQKIVDLNEGLDFRKLAIGQKIKVPKKP